MESGHSIYWRKGERATAKCSQCDTWNRKTEWTEETTNLQGCYGKTSSDWGKAMNNITNNGVSKRIPRFRMWWSEVSKAVDRLSIDRTDIWPRSQAENKSFTAQTKAVSGKWWWQETSKWSQKTACVEIQQLMKDYSFSRVLDKKGSLETGQ